MHHPLREEIQLKLQNGEYYCEKELTLSIISGNGK
ncbi:hypothetical protein SAMN05421787_10359 [Virgibacillus pantothenticus]|nr:hypothetical protein SAMN05421787_10359 [Virgibacillus pantothenticus]